MIENWKCTICGYVNHENAPPERCPVCKAESDKYVQIFTDHDMITAKPREEEKITELRKTKVVSLDYLDEYFDELQSDSFSIEKITVNALEKYVVDSSGKESLLLVLDGDGEITETENMVRLDKPIDDEIIEQSETESEPELEPESAPDEIEDKSDNDNSSDEPSEAKENEEEKTDSDEKSDEPDLSDITFSLRLSKNDFMLIPCGNTVEIANASENELYLLIVRCVKLKEG